MHYGIAAAFPQTYVVVLKATHYLADYITRLQSVAGITCSCAPHHEQQGKSPLHTHCSLCKILRVESHLHSE